MTLSDLPVGPKLRRTTGWHTSRQYYRNSTLKLSR